MYDVIRKIRKERGLTKWQVAKHLNIDRSTYASYESGRTGISIDTIIKLAHFYKVSYATIIGMPEPALPDSE